MVKISEIINITLIILLIALSVFLIYQLIIKILGGSWTTENIAITLLILIIGFLFNSTIKLTRLESNLNNLKNSFCNLAKDFKQHLTKNSK